MFLAKPAFLLLLVFLFGNAGFILAQTDVPPQITNPAEGDTLNYCSDSVKVAPFISIQNILIDEDSEGMKISIANYRRGEDLLVWNEVHGLKYLWNNNYGHVEITGVGTENQYEEAIANVYYKNIATIPKVGVRSFSISLVDADYLPATDHFYRFIDIYDISWNEARDSAANMEYFGLQGYLATIRSAAEDAFIGDKTEGTGWIGASDERVEGRWEWVTGPDSSIHFWQGNENGYPVNGEYSNWGPGEPNNVNGGEYYGHILHHIEAGKWNDLPNGGGGGSYTPRGFIVEFGGMEGDPPVKLSASAAIQVNKIAFSDERDFEICEEEPRQLNVISIDEDYKYTWEPNENIDDPNLVSPTVYPTESAVYKAYGKLDFCVDSAEFNVLVRPLPISKLDSVHVYCKGSSTVLNPGVHSSYLWSTGETTQTITVNDEGIYWVELSTDYPCTITDTVTVKWSERPVIDYTKVDTLVCGSKSQTLNLSFVGVTANTKLISLDPRATVDVPTTLNPTITVDEFDKYLFKMEITDEYSCGFLDTLSVEFHNQPNAIIDIDSAKCKGYNLEVSYGGETLEDALFTWYYNDSEFSSHINLKDTIIPLGYGESNRTVGLVVNEQGCVDSSVELVTVTPIVDIVAENNEGCTPLLVDFDADVTEAVDAYFWEFENGETSDEKSPQVEFVNPELIDQKHDVSLTVLSKEGCSNKGTIKDYVVVHPIPSIDLSFDEADCNPQQMEIFYVGSGSDTATYFWDLSAFAEDEIIQDPGESKGPLEINRSSAPIANIGLYMQSEHGCVTEEVNKPWKRKPVFQIQVDTTEGCPPLAFAAEALVLDDVDEVTFNYDIGEGITGTGDKVEHIYNEAGNKHLIEFIGNSTITGCADTSIYIDTISVYPVPTAAFTPFPEVVLVSEPEVEFENESEAADFYEWDFGDSSAISTNPSPIHSYRRMGFYYPILYSYNNYLCMDSVSHRVVVAFDRIFAPNAFSPNATLEEDREFRIDSEGISEEGYQLMIFNRWGERIFESRKKSLGWKGKMKNDNFAPGGVYTWVLQYLDFRGEKHKQQGVIILVF